MRKAILRNIGYAIKWGYGVMIDRECGDIPNNDLHFCKISSIKKALQKFSKVVWLDTDVIILDDTIDLTQLFDRSPHSDIILADHSDNINNGVMLLRKSEWTLNFMESWAKLSFEPVTYLFSDQGSFYVAMMDYLKKAFRGRRCFPDKCKNKTVIKSSIHYCLNDFLKCLGFPYGERGDMKKISVLPQNQTDYRFNQWYFQSVNYERRNAFISDRTYTWIDDDYFRKGDFVVHTKYPQAFTDHKTLKHVLKDSIKRLMKI